MPALGTVKKSLRKSRIWPVFFAGAALTLLPQKVKGQRRVGEIVVWLSSFPRG